MREGWFMSAAILWCGFIWFVAGTTAALFSSVTGLMVCLLAFWEEGGKGS